MNTKPNYQNFIKKDEPLEGKSTYRVGGRAEVYFAPETEQNILEFLKHEKPQKLTILGGGANVLISSDGVPGVLMDLRGLKGEPTLTGDGHARYLAGTSAQVVLQHGLSLNRKGYAFLAGIPGTIGGALVMNAGTHVGELRDIIHSARVSSLSGVVREVLEQSMGLDYRKSDFLNSGDIILSMVFKDLGPSNGEEKQLVKESLGRRKNSQPLDKPSCGSVFKNPSPDTAAGYLIDQCGLKGKRSGAAVISEKHANFIVIDPENKEQLPTSDDILNLARLARQRVREKFGITLEYEMKLIGSEEFTHKAHQDFE